MPKLYSEVEKDNIRTALRECALSSLEKYGIKKTTVDYIVKEVHIPKGTFYLFYTSKEELFFDSFSYFCDKAERKYLDSLLELDENKIVSNLTDIFTSLLIDIKEMGIYRFLNEEEWILMTRPLKKEKLESVNFDLRANLEKILSYFFIDNKGDIDSFISALSLVIYSLSSVDKVANYKEALRLLVRGLVLQLVGE